MVRAQQATDLSCFVGLGTQDTPLKLCKLEGEFRNSISHGAGDSSIFPQEPHILSVVRVDITMYQPKGVSSITKKSNDWFCSESDAVAQ